MIYEDQETVNNLPVITVCSTAFRHFAYLHNTTRVPLAKANRARLAK